MWLLEDLWYFVFNCKSVRCCWLNFIILQNIYVCNFRKKCFKDERLKEMQGKKRDGIKTCVRDFESMEHDVTISNGKQYNNFSYSFYFLLLWLRICIILFLPYNYCIFNRGVYQVMHSPTHINNVAKIANKFYRIHSKSYINDKVYSINIQILRNLWFCAKKFNKSRKWDLHIY